ncbi:MAG: TraB/GumN family protein [Bacteroidetes bacterium]|nr:TraB/GumN family protein [Bacteroidota bacterium]
MRIFFFFFLSSSFFGNAQLYKPENSLLWEISGNGLKKKSYLFGTFHSNQKDLFGFSDTLFYALDKVELVALETDIFSLFKKMDVRKDAVELKLDIYGDPYSISKKASNTVYGDEDGMPQFMDAYFQQYATNAQKQLYFFETYTDQTKALSEVKKSNQLFFNFSETRKEVMFNLYVNGDIEKIEEFTRKSLLKENYVNLIITRNGEMSEKLDSILKLNSVFCAVGAAHLGGGKGLINLLRKKGYTVRKVEATYSELSITEKRKVKEKNYYNYQNRELNVSAIFPGKPFEFINDDGSIELIYCELGQGNSYILQLIPAQDSLSLEDYASIYIASPSVLEPLKVQLDDGTVVMDGLSYSYPEGLSWVRVNKNNTLVVVMKVYGGNKFMASKRYKNFFAKVWLGRD